MGLWNKIKSMSGMPSYLTTQQQLERSLSMPEPQGNRGTSIIEDGTIEASQVTIEDGTMEASQLTNAPTEHKFIDMTMKMEQSIELCEDKEHGNSIVLKLKGKVIMRLDFFEGKLHVIGDYDKGAEKFFALLQRYVNRYIEDHTGPSYPF